MPFYKNTVIILMLLDNPLFSPKLKTYFSPILKISGKEKTLLKLLNILIALNLMKCHMIKKKNNVITPFGVV